MELSEAKEVVERIEPILDREVFVVAHTFEGNGRRLHVGLTITTSPYSYLWLSTY